MGMSNKLSHLHTSFPASGNLKLISFGPKGDIKQVYPSMTRIFASILKGMDLLERETLFQQYFDLTMGIDSKTKESALEGKTLAS